MIVVEYRLVYQLIGRLQAAKVYSGGSTVLAHGRFRRQIGTESCLSFGNSSFIGCRLISTTIIGITGVSAQQLSDLGSSTVRASGSDNGSSVQSLVYQLVNR